MRTNSTCNSEKSGTLMLQFFFFNTALKHSFGPIFETLASLIKGFSFILLSDKLFPGNGWAIVYLLKNLKKSIGKFVACY